MKPDSNSPNMETFTRGYSAWNLLSQFFYCQGILLLLSFTLVTGDSCQYRSDTAMKNVSGEDTILMDSIGLPLELFCTVDDYFYNLNYSSKNLSFQRAELPVNEAFVSVVDDRTIRLRLENEEPSNNMYCCYLNMSPEVNEIRDEFLDNQHLSKGKSRQCEDMRNLPEDRHPVCWNIVEIVAYPKKMEHMSCKVFNWQELNCSWHVPPNDAQINYTFQFELVSSSGIVALPCPTDVHNSTCKWTLSTMPPYRKDFEKLKVTVTGVNMVNKTSENSFVFDHFSILQVTGPKPRSLRLVNKTSTSIRLEWSIGELQYSPQPWTYKIVYKTLHSNWTSIMCDSNKISTSGEKVFYTVTNLTPGILYDFQVYMKPHNANDHYWSVGYAGNVFRTLKS